MKKRPQPKNQSDPRAQLIEHGKIIEGFFKRVVDEGVCPAGPPGPKETVDAETAELLAATLAEAERIRDERGDKVPYCAEQMIADIALAFEKTGLDHVNKILSDTNQEG